MITVEWRSVNGHPGYEVSNDGRVRNASGRVLKPMLTGQKRKQYYTVRFSTKPRIDAKVHHLVLEAFVGPRPPGKVGRHRNDVSTDNRLDNLTWGTASQNAIDRVRNGKSAQQVLTTQQASEIARRRAAGEVGKALAIEFGVSQQTVCDIHRGRYASLTVDT